MDIKWKNIFKKKKPEAQDGSTLGVVQDAEYVPRPGQTAKALRALCGLLAFVLGVSLTAEGLCFFWNNLSSSGGRQWWEDSFQGDYQNTRQFQSYVENYLETLLTMGAGGPIMGYGLGYGGYDDTTVEYDAYSAITTAGYGSGIGVAETPASPYPPTEENEEKIQDYYRKQAQEWHQIHEKDQNILYRVTKDKKVLYENTDAEMNPWFTNAAPEGYSFLLAFDGGQVRIWKDNKEVDVYGDGYYEGKDGQWYVPGYKNFQAADSVKDVKVTLAVIAQPRQFVYGSYGDSGSTLEYNQLYYLQKNLEEFRENVIRHLVWLGAGVLLLVLYVLLRRDKARADRFLARCTGKVWCEVKLTLLIGLTVWLLPWPEYWGEIWTEVTYAYDGQVATALAESGGWMLRNCLTELAGYSGRLLALFWCFYLLLINDWRYNKRPWRHGILGMLAARELKRPIQKRMSRWAGVMGVAFSLLALEAAYLFLAAVSNIGWPEPLWWYILVLGPCILALMLWGWNLVRQKSLWTDLGALADQISDIRAGDLERELQLPEDADLKQMADDLNRIQQGLHQAVDERTRSERMKVELVTNVSHDLKTPLTSIISYAELLAQEPLEPPASEYVQILSEKAQRLKAMVQDVFEVSKATSGQLPVKLERLDFGRLLRQTLADMDGAISHSGLTFRVSIPQQPIHITADSDRMYRVFQNLISNALKYSLPGSRVYLTLTQEGDTAAASVKNTSAAELDPNADYAARFVRGDESRTDGGSGLGLSIADSFTRACGGRLTIATEADLFTAEVRFPTAEMEE